MSARRRRERAAEAAGPPIDTGAPERARHGVVVPREGLPSSAAGVRVKHECRLDWYLDKASIVDRQHMAGIRFRRDWQLAVAAPTVVGRYGLRVVGHHEFADSQLAARRRTAAAVALLGKDLAATVIDVCCFDNWASGRLPSLREALTMLADHYRIARAAPG